MVEVYNRNVMSNFKYTIKAVTIFMSRIVLKSLNADHKLLFKKLEKDLKDFFTKLNADILFLKFCHSNQLLPKFTNFKLDDVSAVNYRSTIKFKVSLVQIEKLYMSILDQKNLNHVTIVNSEHLNTKLKSFGIKHQPVEHSIHCQ